VKENNNSAFHSDFLNCINTYLLVNVVDPATSLNIKLSFEEGTAEFYISTLRKYPTKTSYQWTSEQNYSSNPSTAKAIFSPIDGSKSIVIDQNDNSFQVGMYFIGVHCSIAESCKSSLTIKNGAFDIIIFEKY